MSVDWPNVVSSAFLSFGLGGVIAWVLYRKGLHQAKLDAAESRRLLTMVLRALEEVEMAELTHNAQGGISGLKIRPKAFFSGPFRGEPEAVGASPDGSGSAEDSPGPSA